MDSANKADKLAAAKKKLKKFQQKGRSTSPVTESAAKDRRKSDSYVSDQGNTGENVKTEEDLAAISSEIVHKEAAYTMEQPTGNLNLNGQAEPITSSNHNINGSESQLASLIEEVHSLRAELESKKNYIELLNHERSEQEVHNQSRHVIHMLEQELDNERRTTHLLEEKVRSYECSQNDSMATYESKIAALNEELRVVHGELNSQNETISILIEEKNEISSVLTHSKELIQSLEKELAKEKQRTETFSLHLKKLEDTSSDVKNHSESQISHLNQKLAAVKEELTSKNQSLADTREELEELQMRHGKQTAELNQRESVLKDLQSQLELMEVNVQQLKNAGPPTVDQTLEKVQRENSKLHEEIVELREQLIKLANEKDLLAQQYQQYIQRLNGQIRTLRSQVESQAVEKRNIEVALELNKERATELEGVIESLKKDRDSRPPLPKIPAVEAIADSQPAKTEETLQQSTSRQEVLDLQARIKEMALNNDQLSKLILEKESRIQELEIRIDRVQSEFKNSTSAHQTSEERDRLLQAMQNDKMAASRAIAQNRQLKMQLEELEKAFIHLSNDKLALTEELQSTTRMSKEYSQKLEVMEPELLQLREQVTELAGQRDATIYWRQELEEAHERIHALSHQNSELKKRVIWNVSHFTQPTQEERPQSSPKEHEPSTAEKKDGSCEECQECHDHSRSSSPHENGDACSGDSGSERSRHCASCEEYDVLKNSFEQLEKQFQRAMENVAVLTDEKQKLEHLVLQLQSETETIGEYVSLYQVQRGLLRKRAEQLTRERQALKSRIDKLTELLPRLAPQLSKIPQWHKIYHALHQNEPTPAVGNGTVEEPLNVSDSQLEDVGVAIDITSILLEMTSEGSRHEEETEADPFRVVGSKLPHENFHPCQVCSGRLMTV